MPSTPQASPRIAVLLLAVGVAVVATRATLASPGAPARPLTWPRTFLRRVATGFRRGDRETVHWSAIGLLSIVAAAMHFGGLRWGVYTAFPWWDLATHALAGLGVGALLHRTFLRDVPVRPTAWLVPAVLAFGAGFEVYEFVFKDFWYGWSARYYLVDTVVDLAMGAMGAVLLVGGVRAGRSLRSADAHATEGFGAKSRGGRADPSAGDRAARRSGETARPDGRGEDDLRDERR